MSVIGSNILAGSSGQGGGGYEIERSLRFNSGDSAYLNRTPSSAGNRKTWTWSGWVKRSALGTNQDLFAVQPDTNNQFRVIWQSDDNLQVFSKVSGTNSINVETQAVYRDVSAWYHLVITLDAASTSINVYVNGVDQALTTITAVANVDHLINSTNPHNIGRNPSNGLYINQYLADVHFIDGQALTPSDFGEYDDNNVWQPKEYAGTYGTNGFHLDFSDAADLGNDSSGANNDWTPNNLVGELATGDQGMDVVTYTGNGGTQSISSLKFSPGLVWFKKRGGSGIARGHALQDIVRGAGKTIESHSTSAEYSDVNALTSFNSDGFSIGSEDRVNENGGTYVAWAWKAGGAAVSNTDGTITSSVSANQTHGFSIISYTGNGTAGATVGHGLNATPSLVMYKNRDSSTNFEVQAFGTIRFDLNQSGANQGNNLTTFTNSTFSLASSSIARNASGSDYIAYCWSEVAGYSKFGSYTGTGATGHKITTGFKPAWILFKRTDSVSNWRIVDRLRGTASLNAETSEAEQTLNFAINDDGFTINETGNNPNASGGSYIYAAFAAGGDGADLDSLLDTPEQRSEQTDTGVGGEVVGNYATWSPLVAQSSGSITLSNGNLDTSCGSTRTTAMSNFALTGKTYWELSFGASTYNYIGMTRSDGFNTVANNNSGIKYTGYTDYSYGWQQTDGKLYKSSSIIATPGAFSNGDILGWAFDADALELKLYKNGTLVHTQSSIEAGTYFPSMTHSNNGATSTANFGQRAFAYTAPSGYKALCTANLSDPTIADGSQYFDTKLWSGDNASSRSITGYNFSPDWVWIKDRSQAFFHELQDTVRGAGKRLSSDSTAAEDTSNQTMTAFNSDGFTVNYISGSGRNTNESGDAYVGWAWDAGSSNTTIAAGSLNSSAYDQSQTWSNGASSNGADTSGNPKTNAFNGNISNFWQSADNITQTYTFSSLSSGLLEAYVYGVGSQYTITVDGANVVNPNANGGWVTLDSDASTVSTVTMVRPGSKVAVGQWRVNGKILVDSGVTPPNFPSIASTVRANPSAGFSIVSYTGTGSTATVGHGLNAAPGLILAKTRSSAIQWVVFHSATGKDKYLGLNTTDAATTDGSYWGSAVTSTTFGLQNAAGGNNSGNMIAYCFAPVEGYSAMGSYVGNGSTDGPFVYTGFRPRWVLTKRTDSNSNWNLFDSARNDYNVANLRLFPNLSNGEITGSATDNQVDLFSNGFRLKGNNVDTNESGSPYIYAAFAENPFKTSRAR